MKPVHLVVRYRDPGSDTPTIRLHQEVIDRRSRAWFGKTGKGLGEVWATRFHDQIGRGVGTFLYLVTREDGRLHVHRGAIERLSYSTPDEALDIPEYYAELGLVRQVSFWVSLRDLRDVGPEALEDMVVVSSGRAVLHSLRSSSPTFIITDA